MKITLRIWEVTKGSKVVKGKESYQVCRFLGGRCLGVWFGFVKGTVKEKRLIRRFLEYSKQKTTD